MVRYAIVAIVALAVGVLVSADSLSSPGPATAAPPEPSLSVDVTCSDASANQLSVSVDAAFKKGLKRVSLILFRGAPGPVADAETPLNLDGGHLPKTYSDSTALQDTGVAVWTTYQVRVQLHGRHEIVAQWDSAAVSC